MKAIFFVKAVFCGNVFLSGNVLLRFGFTRCNSIDVFNIDVFNSVENLMIRQYF